MLEADGRFCSGKARMNAFRAKIQRKSLKCLRFTAHAGQKPMNYPDPGNYCGKRYKQQIAASFMDGAAWPRIQSGLR
ncbi:MAG: hypothetical protein WCC66_16075 [Rhizobiaceae bacterium]